MAKSTEKVWKPRRTSGALHVRSGYGLFQTPGRAPNQASSTTNSLLCSSCPMICFSLR